MDDLSQHTPSFQRSSTPPFSKQTERSQKHVLRNVYFLGASLGIVSAVVVLLVLNLLGPSPEEILEQSIDNLTTAESVTVQFQGIGEGLDKISIQLDYHQDTFLFSRFKLTGDFGDDIGNVTLTGLWMNEDIYFGITFFQIESILLDLETALPDIAATDTYSLLRSVVLGEQWLHFSIPDSEIFSSQSTSNQLSEEEQQQLWNDFKGTLAVRSFNESEYQGKNMYRIGIGFDKERLIAFLQSIKSYNVDIKLSALNSSIDLVESTEGWEEELVVAHIDKETKNLIQLSLSIPNISSEDLKEKIFESLEEQDIGYGAYLEFLPFFSSEETYRDEKPILREIGTITYSNYNEVELVDRPANILEFEDVLEVAKEELPIFFQLFLGSLMTPDIQ